MPAETPDRYRPGPDGPASAAAAGAAAARRDGWDAAALVAYFAYAARFAPADPAAEDYARAAVQYVLQRDRLGIPGQQGVLYAAGLTTAAGAGEEELRAGDLLLTYAGKAAGDAEELAAAVKETPAGQPVQIEFLRRDARGLFARRTATLPRGGAVAPCSCRCDSAARVNNTRPCGCICGVGGLTLLRFNG